MINWKDINNCVTMGELVQDMANSMQSYSAAVLNLGVYLQTWFILLSLYERIFESKMLGHQSKLRLLDRGAVDYLITGQGV